MRKGYSKIATALIFCAAFILVVLGFQTLDVINITNGNNNQQQGGGTGGSGQGGQETPDKPIGNLEVIEITVQDVVKPYDGEEISPEEFIITDEAKLKEGDYVELTDINKTLKNVGEVKTNNTFKIYSENGDDVTKNYDLRVKQGLMKIDPVSIELNVNSDKLIKNYDGKPFKLNSNDVDVPSAFASKIEVFPSVEGEFILPGIYKTNVNFSIRDIDGHNISTNFIYNNIKDINLQINKINMNIEYDSLRKEYDGKPFNINDHIVNVSNLMYGDKLQITTNDSATDVVNDKNIRLKYKVVDKKGLDVTNYYEFPGNEILINILPRNIAFDLYQREKNYDGKALTINKLKVIRGSLAKNHRIVTNIITDTPIINSGTYSLKLKITIFDLNNRNVTSNYSFDEEEIFNFTINPTVIDFNLNTISSSYSYNSDLIDELCVKLNEAISNEAKEKNLMGLSFDSDKFRSIFLGTRKYIIDSSFIKDANSSSDKNYKIHLSKEIDIIKGNASLSIDAKEFNKTYDGKKFELPLNYINVKNKDTEQIINGISISNVKINTIVDKDSSIIIEDINAFDENGINLKALYNIDYSGINTNVKINKRSTTISLKSIVVPSDKVVNGFITKEKIREYLSVSSAFPLADGDYVFDFDFDPQKDITNFDSGDGGYYIIRNVKIYSYQYGDVTKNYVINGDAKELSGTWIEQI